MNKEDFVILATAPPLITSIAFFTALGSSGLIQNVVLNGIMVLYAIGYGAWARGFRNKGDVKEKSDEVEN